MRRIPPLGKGRVRVGIKVAGNTIDVFADTSAACEQLSKKDKTLAHAYAVIGKPHIRRRPGGFEALFRIIVEQQVSVPSAQAIWARCLAGVSPLTPASALRQGEEGLRACGLTRQKAHYVARLAEMIERKQIDLGVLARLDDDEAAALLQSIKGIGPWTAAIYLLFCEGRVDIWPRGDVALLAAYRAARVETGIRGPTTEMKNFDARAQKWAPHRGLAAHILWTFYAHIRGREPV